MVASSMEAKKLGMCTKSLFVVPNHLTGQIGREFMQLYPSANIMVADKKTLNRKQKEIYWKDCNRRIRCCHYWS